MFRHPTFENASLYPRPNSSSERQRKQIFSYHYSEKQEHERENISDPEISFVRLPIEGVMRKMQVI